MEMRDNESKKKTTKLLSDELICDSLVEGKINSLSFVLVDEYWTPYPVVVYPGLCVNLVNFSPSSKKDDNLETLYTVNFKETFTFTI